MRESCMESPDPGLVACINSLICESPGPNLGSTEKNTCNANVKCAPESPSILPQPILFSKLFSCLIS